MKGEREPKTRQQRDFRRLQGQIALILAGLIVLMTVFETVVILQRSEQTLRGNAMEYITADARQLEININSYILKIEQTASLMFADEDYYQFDATDDAVDDYEKIQAKKRISDRISDIALTSNFSDFGVVYANDDTVGWISQVTGGMFPDGGLYAAMAASITDPQKEDGWSFGYKGNNDRLYYVKRLNRNAVLVISIYSHELESLFEQPEQLDNLTVRFVDPSGKVFFSTTGEEIGQPLPEDIAALKADSGTRSIMNADYLVTTNTCSNGWFLVCSATSRSVMEDVYALRYYVFWISAAAAALFLVVGLLFYRRMTAPMGNMVRVLNRKASSDQLTKLANKMTFEDLSKDRIARAQSGSWAGIVMMDLDRFKTINDTCGHVFGDSVIARMGELLRAEFQDPAYVIGRVGGDEFAVSFVFDESTYPDFPAAQRKVRGDLEKLRKRFDDVFREDQARVQVSFSAGAAMNRIPERQSSADAPETMYEDLYRRADTVLYRMKGEGRNRTGFEWAE